MVMSANDDHPEDDQLAEYGFLPQPESIQRHVVSLEAYNFLPKEMSLIVDAAPGCGGVIWPASLVLTRYLAHSTALCHGENCTIVELGSGTGITAIALASLAPNATIFATDQSELLPLIRENIALNEFARNVHAVELKWGQALPEAIPRPTLVVVADCVYLEASFQALVDTLKLLLGDETKCLFCYKKRRNADKRFFRLLKRDFRYEEVKDDPNRANYSRDGIFLYRLLPRRFPQPGSPLHNQSSP